MLVHWFDLSMKPDLQGTKKTTVQNAKINRVFGSKGQPSSGLEPRVREMLPTVAVARFLNMNRSSESKIQRLSILDLF